MENDTNIDRIIREFERHIYLVQKLIVQMESEKGKEITQQRIRFLVGLNVMGKTKLKDIAAKIGISIPAACLMLGKLEKDKLVKREIDKEDRRNTYYSVTLRGKALIKRNIEDNKKFIIKIFEKKGEKDIEKFFEVFKETNDLLSEYIQ